MEKKHGSWSRPLVIRQPGDFEAYVDSPLLTNRLRFNNELSARLSGTRGVYKTWLRLASRTAPFESRCNCPDKVSPCKHVAALEATWRVNPASFLDLDEFLSVLARHPREQLVAMIGRLIVRWPQVLALLGVEGFRRDEDEEDDDLPTSSGGSPGV